MYRIFIAFFTLATLAVQAQDKYTYFVDLTAINEDRLSVELIAPAIDDDEIIFQMPKVVPGTYSVYDFGRFVSDLKAFDKSGLELPVEQMDDNRWRISNATELHRVSYITDDTWDTELDNVIFEPAGTNFEEGENYVINTHTMFGYFEDMEMLPFEVRFQRPVDFYGATALERVRSYDSLDIFMAPDYHALADGPIMFSEPDTVLLNIGNAEVLVAVYSPEGKVTAENIAEDIEEVLEAQRKYLGGTLPVDRYAFIIYLTNEMSLSGGFGALEHSYSSMYYLIEMSPTIISQMVKDIAAHEFFHILTPLNIHSEEIHYFDFADPEMSQHLWLYEGVTEYFASHVQVMYELIPFEQYLSTLEQKIVEMLRYNDTVPFTVISENILDEYQDEFTNVYEKGALIGALLDIRLNELSDGSYSLRQLMADLATKYGKDRPFEDDELFDEIEDLTYEELEEFFERYVGGSEPLPLQEYFAKVGINYVPESEQQIIDFGFQNMAFNPETNRLYITGTEGITELGEKLKFQQGDEIMSVNGEELTLENMQEVITDFVQNTEEGERITIVVERENRRGKKRERKLRARAIATTIEVDHSLVPMTNPTPEQLRLRNAWLGWNE